MDYSRKDLFKLLAIPDNLDVVGLYNQLLRAKAEKRKIKNPCSWTQAYKVPISEESTNHLRSSVPQQILLLDPFAGGGSIPLEAIRMGLPIVANDLNPVAYICLKGTVEYPAQFGMRLIQAVEEFCAKIHRAAKTELLQYFPKNDDEDVFSYLWTRTIACPHCSLEIPLSPNWWVAKTDGLKVAVRPEVTEEGHRCSFTVIQDPKQHGFDPDIGTASGGDAICPRCRSTVSSEQVKAAAQADRMGHQLYCVCTKIPKMRGRGKDWIFRAPTDQDIKTVDAVNAVVEAERTQWPAWQWIPSERYPEDANDTRPLQYGMPYWSDFFNPRQLLTHAIYMKQFSETKRRLFDTLVPGSDDWQFASAVTVYGAMVFDTCVNYNSMQCRWHSGRCIIAGSMDMQAFPFRSSYAEWNQVVKGAGYEWAMDKTVKALRELLALLPTNPGTITVLNNDAAALPCADRSVPVIVTDPPYSDNVMYAEISDFFYVWLKRLVGDLFPVQFADDLTNKSDEAVANSARFCGAKRGQAKVLAEQDYAAKMEAAFREMNRILTDDGVLCVMFTHRKAEAWEGLAESLMNAGFVLRSSWPVHTEPGDKFGKTNKGALKVTVLLYCRKRPDRRPGRWEDVVDEIRETAKEKVAEYQGYGITGPDLLVSLYGPALGRFSEYYPVKDITGRVVRAREALAVVAEVVNEYLTGDIRGADMESLAYLNLLRSAPGLTMETDLARLSTVFGGNTSLDALDVKGGAGLVKKAGKEVKILTARKRLEMGVLSPDRPSSFKGLMDVVHAAILLYERQGIGAVQRMLEEVGRDAHDAGVISVLGAIGAIGEDGSAELVAEARIANALLEALGHTSAGVGKTGERITHWIE
jgi:adenine-specific DNA methylase